MKNLYSKARKGFTLIELLVAMAITTIIITILVSITGLSLDTWNRSRSEISAARQGKAMIDSMTRDFESLVIRKGNDFEWLYAKFQPGDGGPNNNTYESPSTADLVFFSAATDRYDGDIAAGQGDVSTVAYQLAFKDPIGGSKTDDAYKTFVLYRKLINPDLTFGKTPSSGILGIPVTPTGDALLNAAKNQGDDIDEENNFICENVYQFTLSFHIEVTRDDGKLISVPIHLSSSSSASSTEIFKIGGNGLQMDNNVDLPKGVSNIDELKAGRLTSVEISLTVLTDFGLSQMERRSTIPDLEDFIAENSYNFSKLIPVPGG